MYGLFTYRGITPIERIVFANGFADAKGNVQGGFGGMYEVYENYLASLAKNH